MGISMAPLGQRLVLLVFSVVMTTQVFGKTIIPFLLLFIAPSVWIILFVIAPPRYVYFQELNSR